MRDQQPHGLSRKGLDDDVIDKEVAGSRQCSANVLGDIARVVDEQAQLAENRPSQHCTQEHVEHVPDEEDDANAAI